MNFRQRLRIWSLVPCWLFSASVPAATPTTPQPALEVQKLVDQYGCMSCHGLLRKQVGPGFAQIAERYRGEPAADVTLAMRLRTGTVGRWGRLVMPRQAHMTEAESLALSRWVLARP